MKELGVFLLRRSQFFAEPDAPDVDEYPNLEKVNIDATSCPVPYTDLKQLLLRSPNLQ